MAGGNIQNCSSHKPCDLKTHTLEPRLPAVCEKNVFSFFCFSASGKSHSSLYNNIILLFTRERLRTHKAVGKLSFGPDKVINTLQYH